MQPAAAAAAAGCDAVDSYEEWGGFPVSRDVGALFLVAPPQVIEWILCPFPMRLRETGSRHSLGLHNVTRSMWQLVEYDYG